MTPENRQQLRLSLLTQAEAASERGLTLQGYLIGAKTSGLQVNGSDLLKEIVYLTDKGLMKSESPLISPELIRVRITAQGRDYLAQEGF